MNQFLKLIVVIFALVSRFIVIGDFKIEQIKRYFQSFVTATVFYLPIIGERCFCPLKIPGCEPNCGFRRVLLTIYQP